LIATNDTGIWHATSNIEWPSSCLFYSIEFSRKCDLSFRRYLLIWAHEIAI